MPRFEDWSSGQLKCIDSEEKETELFTELQLICQVSQQNPVTFKISASHSVIANILQTDKQLLVSHYADPSFYSVGLEKIDLCIANKNI